MKKLLISALAVGMLTACSQDETVEMQAPNAISFAGAFVENVTRAAADPSITTDNIKNFSVWGYVNNMNETGTKLGQVFNDVTVTNNNGVWTYNPLQYWAPNNKYHFFALTTNTGKDYKGEVSKESLAADGIGKIMFETTDGAEDLLYATAEATTGASITTAPAPVKFAFDHLLSKVKFTFKNGFATGYSTIEVTNIEMTVPGKGTIALNKQGTYTWENLAGSAKLKFGDLETLPLTESTVKGGVSVSECTYERLTIPAAATQDYLVTFDAKLYQDGALVQEVVDQEATISGTELKPGYAYNFVAVLDASNFAGGLYPIEFEAQVAAWNKDTDINVYQEVTTETELTAAIAKGGEVKLMNDITLTKPLEITNEATVYLNGKTLENKTIANNTCNVFRVNTGGVLTINGEGAVEVNAESGYADVIRVLGGEVNINGGNYSHTGIAAEGADLIYVNTGTVNVNGGSFKSAYEAMHISVDTYGYRSALLNCADANYKNGTAKINVKGGSFYKFDPAKNTCEGANTSYVPAGYKSEKKDDTFTVTAE